MGRGQDREGAIVSTIPATGHGSEVDKDALRRKYREERDKRLRPDGNDQYIRLTGQLAHYLDDPYTPVRRPDHRARPP